MGKKLRNFFVAFVAMLGLAILFSSQTTTTKAADYTYVTSPGNNGLLTDMTIDQKNYGTASQVQLHLNWDATGKDLKNGDTWQIELPDTLKVKDPGETIDLTNDAGEKVGEAVLNSDNTITVTFTNVEDQNDFSGHLDIKSGIGVGTGANVGDNNVNIGDKNSNMTVVTSNSDFSKKGVIGTDADGNAIVTWTILVNRNSGYFPNLVITDNNINDGLQTYVPGSLTVQEATWTNDDKTYYKRGRTLDSNEYTLVDSKDGFILSGLPNENQFYAVTYQTTIDNPANASNGTMFRNKATYTWGDGSGGNGNNSGSVSGSVSKESNSGSGNGNNILGAVTLTKTSADNETIVLPGAIYSVYKYGSDEPIKTDLTTDANGQINVTGLERGNYYFLETKAPDGYQTNGNEIPFTISGTDATAVQVSAEDEPDIRSNEGSIVIMKIDSETGYRLGGISFDIINKATGETVGEIKTDNLGIGHYYNLPYGEYILKETNTPDGYIKGDDIEFTIDSENPTPAMISIENEPANGSDDTYAVDLQKFDRTDMKTGVAGAEYSLYTKDGELISTDVTNEQGIISVDGLKPGDYYFLETKAPDGYDLNPEKIEFTLSDNHNGIGLGTLETSDPKTNSGNEGGNGGNTTEPGDNNNNGGNEGENPDTDGNGNEGNTDGNNGNGDNNGGIIVDPGNSNNNNNNNGGDSGLITNPLNPGNANNGSSSSSSSSNNKLPQTGTTSGIVASLMGLIILIGTVVFKRRNI